MSIFTRRRPAPPAVEATTVVDGIVSPGQASPNQLGAALFAELVGAADSEYLEPSRTEAMSVPAVARIRRTVCTTVGRLPAVIMRGAAPAPSTRGLASVAQPERGRPAFITYAWTADALLFYGRAWWVVTERFAEDGRPAYFEWVPEWQAVLSTKGQLIGHQDGRSFAPRDVIRIDGPDEGCLHYAGRSIRGAIRLDRAWLRTADNPTPTTELHDTSGAQLDDAEIDGLIDRFVANRKRSNGAVGYTSSSLELKVHGSPVEQLLIAGRNAAALDVARHLGVPAWVVDVGVEGSSLTYSNVPSRSRELIDFGVAGYLEAIAGRLSLDDVLPRGLWCRFDTDRLLAADFGERMTAYKTAVDSGVYTVDELRARELGIPLEEGDAQ